MREWRQHGCGRGVKRGRCGKCWRNVLARRQKSYPLARAVGTRVWCLVTGPFNVGRTSIVAAFRKSTCPKVACPLQL